MQRWLAASFVLAVLLSAAACGGAQEKAAPGTAIPPGWNQRASADGLTLTIDPPQVPIGGAVRIWGSVPPELRPIGSKVTVELWPKGNFRTLGRPGESQYKGEAWPATVSAVVGPDGRFDADMMKIPWVIKVGDELRLVEPGQHFLALVLDETHATFVPFEVTPEPPLPTVSLEPYFSFGAFQFLDSQTGWLSGSSCREQQRAMPDEYGNIPTRPPPICKGGFYGTTDGGQTWSLLSRDAIGPFVMDGSGVGLSAGGFCEYSPCESAILVTKDGGAHWIETFSSTLWLTGLTLVGGEAWVIGNSCGYSDRGSCPRYLLKSTDGGQTWSQSELPVKAFGLSISRPTARDAWIATSTGGPGTAEIFVTHDGGATWESLPHPTAGAAWEAEIFFRTPQQGWLLVGGQPGAGSEAKELFGTVDGGMTWTHLLGGPADMSPGYVGPLLFTSDQEGWLALAHVALLHTTDGGKHWTASLSAADDRGDPSTAVQFTDGQHGWTMTRYYLADRRQALWSTQDGGATWQQVPLPTPEEP